MLIFKFEIKRVVMINNSLVSRNSILNLVKMNHFLRLCLRDISLLES